MNFGPEEIGLADKSTCANIRADLKMCLLNTDCCKKEKKTPRQCLKERNSSVPDQCYLLYSSFFECKRSMMDNRRRFRGVRE